MELTPHQLEVAGFFNLIGSKVSYFTSNQGTHYVSCMREGNEYIFSYQNKNSKSKYILTINNRYVLVCYTLEDITEELRKVVSYPEYVIKRSDEANKLGNITGY